MLWLVTCITQLHETGKFGCIGVGVSTTGCQLLIGGINEAVLESEANTVPPNAMARSSDSARIRLTFVNLFMINPLHEM